ncbi:MAG TPA: tape measure protein, partial [Pyrinomonadaceae bacterium]|nr:tape measure protein [Pyrinomonadaceae bacterium]
MDFKLRYKITADSKQAKAEFADLDRAIDRISSRAGTRRGIGDVFGGNVAAQAFTRFSSMLADGGTAVLDYSAKLEQTKISFETLMGGAAAAAKHIDDLRKLSTSTPLEFQSLTKMSQRLQGAGIEAGKVTELIKDIGNTAAATGEVTAERMEGIGVAISQVFAKGKVSAEEMEQLAER